jgi:hypothetical protein
MMGMVVPLPVADPAEPDVVIKMVSIAISLIYYSFFF